MESSQNFPAYYTVLCARAADAIDAIDQQRYQEARELMRSCKKVILCYPAGYDKPSCALRFVDENFHLQKIYAAYMNIAGNTAAEFKNNINSFVLKIECLL